MIRPATSRWHAAGSNAVGRSRVRTWPRCSPAASPSPQRSGSPSRSCRDRHRSPRRWPGSAADGGASWRRPCHVRARCTWHGANRAAPCAYTVGPMADRGPRWCIPPDPGHGGPTVSDIDEIVGEFLVESYENLDRYDADMLALEQDPRDAEVLSSVFRTIHTIKGTSGFFGFERLEKLAHVAENLLGRLREGELDRDEEIASALLDTGDTLRRMLGVIEDTGEEGDLDVSALADRLTRLYEGGDDAAAAEGGDDASADVEPADDPQVLAAEPAAEAAPDPDAPPVPRIGELLVGRGKADQDALEEAAKAQQSGDARRIGEILVNKGLADPEDVEAYAEEQARSTGRSLADSSIRVDVGLLDELMNLVGELVLARNQIVQLAGEEQDSRYAGASQRLNLITTELQEGVMKTRMQPIGNVWNKLPRVVRDLSLSCGKQVDLQMVGQDTELDKTIIEAIKDPLTHLVRNAVDHGVELPEVRRAAGKP